MLTIPVIATVAALCIVWLIAIPRCPTCKHRHMNLRLRHVSPARLARLPRSIFCPLVAQLGEALAMSMIRPRPLPPFPTEPRVERVKVRRRIRRVSTEKRRWQALYSLALRFLVALNPRCRVCASSMATEGHHYFGQIGALILLFIPVCNRCHRVIEDNKKQARLDGWILYK